MKKKMNRSEIHEKLARLANTEVILDYIASKTLVFCIKGFLRVSANNYSVNNDTITGAAFYIDRIHCITENEGAIPSITLN